MDSFISQRNLIIQELATITDGLHIHFSFDLWSSTNHMALLGIVGHWTSSDGAARQGLLSLQRVNGAHSGENQCSALWKVLETYDIFSKIDYFVLDNASNNDTAMQHLQEHLVQRKVPFNQKERRFRCFGHILNLVVKAFLYGKTDNLDG